MKSDSKDCYWIDNVSFESASFVEPLIKITLLGTSFPSGHQQGTVLNLVNCTRDSKDLPTSGGYFLVPSHKYDFEALSKKTLEELLVDDCPLIRTLTSVIAKQGIK